MQLEVGGLASLPLLPAVPPPMQMILTFPQRASCVQTARAATAAASAGVLPEISTCVGVLLPPHATKAIPIPIPSHEARMEPPHRSASGEPAGEP